MGSVKFKDLKAYVRYDGNGRVVAGSMVFRKKKPKNGRWYEISSNLCCNPGGNTTTTTTTVVPTTTSTTTATPVPIEYIMSIFSDASACGTTSVSPGFSLYSAESNPLAVTVFYTDASLTTPVSGNDSWKTYVKASDQATLYSAYVDLAGNLSGNTAC